ncbi:MAG: phosphonate metabolism transcriptional regulator PhnF [Pseudomonadota bacterium]
MGRPALWRDIANFLERDIRNGTFETGSRLPTEAALSERFAVNRHTVRRALSHLTDAGLIYTRQGAGAFVREKVTNYPIGSRVRFHQSVEAVGRHPSKTILHTVSRQATDEEAEALQIEQGARIYLAESLARINGTPVAHSTTVFPAEKFPNMISELAENPSITAAFAAHGVNDFTRASTEITAVLANATSASLLRLSPGAPLIRTRLISVDINGAPVEFGLTWFSGDRITLTVDGSVASQS